MTTIEIHVIAWPGKENSAAMISSELIRSGYNAKVIYALSGTNHIPAASGWLVLDGFGYGKIFEQSLAVVEADVLLHVHADCFFPRWGELAARCHGLFESSENLGVWSPTVDWSSWTLARTRMGEGPAPSTHSVTTVDGIVWAISAPVVARLKNLDYLSNPKGWGIDLAASAIAHRLGLDVVMDEAVFVQHPRGSGYDHGDAGREAEVFAQQLGPDELRSYRLSIEVARARIAAEKMTARYKLRRWARRIRALFLDPLYRILLRR